MAKPPTSRRRRGKQDKSTQQSQAPCVTGLSPRLVPHADDRIPPDAHDTRCSRAFFRAGDGNRALLLAARSATIKFCTKQWRPRAADALLPACCSRPAPPPSPKPRRVLRLARSYCLPVGSC